MQGHRKDTYYYMLGLPTLKPEAAILVSFKSGLS